MPVIFKDIERKAEVSHSTVSRVPESSLAISHETVERIHRLVREVIRVTIRLTRSLKISCSQMLGTITHRVADLLYSRVQGGLENLAHALISGNSLITSACRNKLGIYLPVVFIHHRAFEILLHSIYYDDVNVMFIETTFT